MGELAEIDRVATLQRGLLTREQAVAILGNRRAERWVTDGRLVGIHPTVYRLAGSPNTWEQQLLAAVLAAGGSALASHRAAARLWGLLEEAPVEISVPRPRLPRLRGVIVHRSRDVHLAHKKLRSGIPTTTPMRALVDLGAVMPEWHVRDALERGLTARLYSMAAVEWALTEVARKGRQGGGVLRRILDQRALGSSPADGLLESRFARICQVFGLPMPLFQFPFGKYRIDFAYPELMIAIEVDGWETHSSPAALASDLARQNALVMAGWTLLRFTWHDVIKRPDYVASQIRAVLGAATAA